MDFRLDPSRLQLSWFFTLAASHVSGPDSERLVPIPSTSLGKKVKGVPGDSGKGGGSGASQVSLDLIIIKEEKHDSGDRGEQREIIRSWQTGKAKAKDRKKRKCIFHLYFWGRDLVKSFIFQMLYL